MPESSSTRFIVVLGIVSLFGIITFALAAATLGTLNKRYSDLENQINSINIATNPIATTTTRPPLNSPLAESIRIDELMNHLHELQRIADGSNHTRAIGTQGFAETVNYIESYLKTNAPNLNTFREPFPVRNFSIRGTPQLNLFINDVETPFNYSTNLTQAHFTYVTNSGEITQTRLNITAVLNNGCVRSDWPNVVGKAVLVRAGGPCTYAEKGELAANQSVSALLFYNSGATVSNLAPAIVRLRQLNQLPALSLSYAVGQRLVDAANGNNASISIDIQLEDYPSFNVTNICADTMDGNSNETIVVGSHSDSVPAGPGINDNGSYSYVTRKLIFPLFYYVGSGTMANLVLATNLARLYASGNYPKYRYRVRFCWWGAEEIGLVGSIHHVQQAQGTSAALGNRLQDYLINLNYDMIGSPNYFFGIYDGKTARPETPSSALYGSIQISEKFRDWFIQQNLPWNYTEFSGRSDYGPFLAAGVVAGGLFTGADDIKTSAVRKLYEQLGPGQGGFAGAILDPCYHLSCDTMDNINRYAYEKMTQAAAYILESLGRESDLEKLLYPTGRSRARLPDDYFPRSDYF